MPKVVMTVGGMELVLETEEDGATVEALISQGLGALDAMALHRPPVEPKQQIGFAGPVNERAETFYDGRPEDVGVVNTRIG